MCTRQGDTGIEKQQESSPGLSILKLPIDVAKVTIKSPMLCRSLVWWPGLSDPTTLR